jgi:hypothetical protein
MYIRFIPTSRPIYNLLYGNYSISSTFLGYFYPNPVGGRPERAGLVLTAPLYVRSIPISFPAVPGKYILLQYIF